MSLTRRDIVGTIAQVVVALTLSLGLVGGAVWHFTAFAGDLKHQQERVLNVERDVHDLRQDVTALAQNVTAVIQSVGALQQNVILLQDVVLKLQGDVGALVAAQENYATKDDLAEILEWVRQQQSSADNTDTSPETEQSPE